MVLLPVVYPRLAIVRKLVPYVESSNTRLRDEFPSTCSWPEIVDGSRIEGGIKKRWSERETGGKKVGRAD
jgi:hypothetical protein